MNVQGQFLRGPGIGGSGGSDGSVIGEIIIDGGTVVAKGADAAPDIGVARIAGNFNDPNRRLGKITINGGNITDIGGDQYDHYYGGPGIGTTTTPFDSITQTTLDNEAGKDNTYLATSGLVPQTSDLVPFAPGDNKLTSAKWSFVDPNLTLENEGNDPYCVRK